jgi:HAD superfamily hydrolase (TIGR01662 family)
MKLNKAVFVDLDGTLVRTKSGSEFVERANDWEFVSGILPKLKYLVSLGYNICLVSNQGGIETNKVTEEQIKDMLHSVEQELEQYVGAGINVAYCPYMEGYYRKPNPGMAYYFAIELKLSLKNSIMIGNTVSDSHFAKEAHIGTYFDVDSFIKDDITIYEL